MTRRAFAAGGLALVSLPVVARAQTRVYRIAIWDIALPVSDLTETSSVPQYRAFFAELRRLGFIEGQNLKVSTYSSAGRAPETYPEVARSIVSSSPDAVLTNGSVAAERVMDFSRTVPIVCPGLPDPVATGLATSLSKPGGNLTGFMVSGGFVFSGLQVQLLKDTVPNAARLRYLSSGAVWAQQGKELEPVLRQAATSAGLELTIDAMDPPFDEIGYRTLFDRVRNNRDDSLYVGAVTVHIANVNHIIRGAAQAKIPVIYSSRDSVLAGGLMTYVSDSADRYRKAGGYVARIITGENPADMPIEIPTTYNLIINARTAKALGIVIPPRILALANEVIE